MTQVIGITQLKGGTGRSTLATNTAGLLSRTHYTALIDCDMPQGTAASWYALRQEGGTTRNLTLSTVTNHKELLAEIDRLKKDHSYIVLDAPPRIAEITRLMLMVSDLLLIPMGPSAPEIWATSDLLDTIMEAQKERPDLFARLVWTRFRANTKSAQELSEAVNAEVKVPALKTRLGFRVAYTEALGRGLVADEWPDQATRAEVDDYEKEIRQLLKKQGSK